MENKSTMYVVAGVAVLALLVGGYALMAKPAVHSISLKINPSDLGVTGATEDKLGATTAGEISYWTGSGNFGADLAVGADLTVAGKQVNTGSLFTGGAVASLTTSSATYTLAAANVCDNSEVKFTPLGAATTVTFPASSTLFASCLTAVGQAHDFVWNSVATGTVLAAGAGGTAGYSSSLTIAAGKYAVVRIIRDAAATYQLLVVNVLN
jgi:hypothetical protein